MRVVHPLLSSSFAFFMEQFDDAIGTTFTGTHALAIRYSHPKA